MRAGAAWAESNAIDPSRMLKGLQDSDKTEVPGIRATMPAYRRSIKTSSLPFRAAFLTAS
jgi:hypothetical protein